MFPLHKDERGEVQVEAEPSAMRALISSSASLAKQQPPGTEVKWKVKEGFKASQESGPFRHSPLPKENLQHQSNATPYKS